MKKSISIVLIGCMVFALLTGCVNTPSNPTYTTDEPTDPQATTPTGTEPPDTNPPATNPPATNPPATEPPATNPPATEPPATNPPATEPPATNPPATEPPATTPPATKPPVTNPPATNPPETGSTNIVFLAWPETTSRNKDVTVTIQGAPNTKYSITVRYKSGPSTADGLEDKVSDANGKVSWTWHIGGRTSPGTFTITVSGGGKTETVKFTIVA